MKRLLCLTAAFALAAPAAFAQMIDTAPPNLMLGMNVYLRSSGSDAESASIADLVGRALEKSRILHLVAAPIEDTMVVEAPVDVIKESDGKRLKVTFRVTPKNSTDTSTHITTCAITQMERCADAIAQRAERIARENLFQG